jgi:hypothetical protein
MRKSEENRPLKREKEKYVEIMPKKVRQQVRAQHQFSNQFDRQIL